MGSLTPRFNITVMGAFALEWSSAMTTTDRDELAAAIALGVDGVDGWDFAEAPGDYRAEMREGADAVWAVGWRKMPGAAELTDCIISVDDQRDTDVLVAAVLALLDGHPETGGSDA